MTSCAWISRSTTPRSRFSTKGSRSADQLLRDSGPKGWDRICAKCLLPRWLEKAKTSIASYSSQLFHVDTLAAQLTPCLSPGHPSSIEQNLQARLEIIQKTQGLGTVVGTGEGISPSWLLPWVDFFEGLMSLRSYADPGLKIPAGHYDTDLGGSCRDNATITLDETRRVPLYQLGLSQLCRRHLGLARYQLPESPFRVEEGPLQYPLRHDADVAYRPKPLG